MAKGIVDNLTDTLNPTLEFFGSGLRPAIDILVRNIAGLSIKFFKVHLLSLSAAFMVVFAFMALIMGIDAISGNFLSSPENAEAASPVIFALTVLAIFGYYLVLLSVAKSANILMHEQRKGGNSGIIEISKGLVNPMFKYMLANIGIVLAFIGLPILVLNLLQGAPMLFSILALVFVPYLLLFILAYFFLAQFWLWELLIEKKEIIESLRHSIKLVKKNALGAFVFDLALLIPLAILYMFFFFGGAALGEIFQGRIADALSGDAMEIIIAYFSMLAIMIVFTTIASALSDLVYMPFMYSYWSYLKKEEQPPRSKERPAKRKAGKSRKKTSK